MRLPRFRDESGIALISAIGILAVLSILGVTVVTYSSASYRTAEYSSSRSIADHVAEAGLNQAAAVLATATNPASPSALPPQTTAVEGGTVTTTGVLAGDTWTLTAVATVKNPTGAADITRRVKSRVRISYDTSSSGNEAWNYNYADDTSTCTEVKNSVKIGTPFFVRGNLCLSNTAEIYGSPLKVGGTVTLTNTSHIGTATSRVGEVHVAGGCRIDGGAPVSPCGDAQRVYAAAPGADTNVGTITKPPIDLAKWYAESRPGPLGNCTQGSFPGGFDNDTAMNRSLPAKVTLMPASAYDCVFTSGEHTLGRIAWTGGAAGTLTVMGTIFFDGDIEMTGSTKGVYQGRGVIYASGTIEMGNSTELCGVAACDVNAWDPNENLLVFVAGSSTDKVGFRIHNSAKLQGAVYAVGDYQEENYVDMQGPVVANQLYYQNSAETLKWIPIWALVVGTPAETTGTTVTQVSGSWGE